MSASAPLSQRDVLRGLAEQIRQCQGGLRAGSELISSGCPALDERLPAGGLHRGTLVEWVAAVPGSGATRLALAAACQACEAGRLLAVVDRRGRFYPPAAANLGLAMEQLLVVRPNNSADEAWAIDQALRCGGVGAVLCWPEKLDDHTFRRWQLAAETSGAMGFLVRPATAHRQPSWADVKLLVTPLAVSEGEWKLEVLRCRQGGECGARSAAEGVIHATVVDPLRTPHFTLRTSS